MKIFKEIKNFLSTNYPQIGKIHNIQLLDHNNINSKNYLISTRNSKFILHQVTDGSQKRKINSMCDVLDYCVKKNVKVPEPIRNFQNSYSIDTTYLTKYYEGHHYSGKRQELKETAKHLAILHKVLNQNIVPYNFRLLQKYYNILSDDELKLILKMINNKKSLTSFDKIFLQYKKFFLKIINEYWQSKIQNRNYERCFKQLIHNDLHPKNVIYYNGKISTILDFSSMRKGTALEDVAFTSYRFASYDTNKISEIRENIHFFIQEYLKYNDISTMNPDLLEYLLIKKILSRLSLILKMNFLSNLHSWNFDFKNHIQFLKHAYNTKIFNK